MTADEGLDTAAPDELETASVQAETDEPEIVFEGDEPEAEATPDDDHEEIEREGKTYRIPKALKPELLMHADYTRKTQEVAEARKAFEAEQKAFNETAKEINEARGKVFHADHVISELSKVDFNKLWTEDPVEAGRLSHQLAQWKDHRTALQAEANEKAQTLAKQQHESAAKQVEEKVAAIRATPGWSQAAENANIEYVKSIGLTGEQILPLLSPKFYKMIDAARRASEAEAKVQAAPKKAPVPIEPTPTVQKAKAPARVVLNDKMSTDEWMAARQKQIQRRASR